MKTIARALAGRLLALALAAPLAAAGDFEAGVAAARAGDYPRAMKEWKPLAKAGKRDAQFNLGLLYENGLGVPQDRAAAAAWYRRAAELGHPAAQYNVGLFYAMGRSVEPSDIEGYAWLKVGEENGAPPTGLLETLKKNMAPARLEEAEGRADAVRRHCKLD